MVDFAGRIFYSRKSLLISLIKTAALVYFSLQWFMVRLMRRLRTDNIVGFRENPEDASRASVHPLSKRPDEIGVAERELAAMQSAVRTALRRKTHLAARPALRLSRK